MGVYQRVASPSPESIHSNELLKARWIKEISKHSGIIVADFYFDESHVNARNHPECERLLADCQAGKIDAVMVHGARIGCSDEQHLKQVISEICMLTPPVDVYFSMEDFQVRRERDSR